MKKIRNSKSKGISLIEFLTIIAILMVLAGMAIPAFRFFQKESDLKNSAQEIINTLRLAQNKTLASEVASSWGVYFSTTTWPHQYTLFQGIDFTSRTTTSDEVHNLSESVEIYEINLAGGKKGVVFDRITGTTSQSGTISLRLKADHTKTRTIYIEGSGLTGLTSPSIPSDEDRLKDSRHVHFDYDREISTSTEWLTLIFTYDTSTTTKDIIIADNIKDGQIYWEGEVDVAGSIQKLKIHTHRLNNPDTQFCVHRDRRYNDKALIIEINSTPDPDVGTLISYSGAGETATGTSIFVSNLEWQ